MPQQLSGLSGRFQAAYAWGTAKTPSASAIRGFFNMFRAGSPLYYPSSQFRGLIGEATLERYQLHRATTSMQKEMAELGSLIRRKLKGKPKRTLDEFNKQYQGFQGEIRSLLKSTEKDYGLYVDFEEVTDKIANMKQQLENRLRALEQETPTKKSPSTNIKALTEIMGEIKLNGLYDEYSGESLRFEGNFKELIKAGIAVLNRSQQSYQSYEFRSPEVLAPLIKQYAEKHKDDSHAVSAVNTFSKSTTPQKSHRTSLGHHVKHDHFQPITTTFFSSAYPSRYDTHEQIFILPQQKAQRRSLMDKLLGRKKVSIPSSKLAKNLKRSRRN